MTNLIKAATAAEHFPSHLMLTPPCEEGSVITPVSQMRLRKHEDSSWVATLKSRAVSHHIMLASSDSPSCAFPTTPHLFFYLYIK